MLAIIAEDNKWVYIDQVIGSIEPLLIDHFSERHPRIQFIDVQQQRWDGWYRKYDERNSRIARPLLQELKNLAKKHNWPFQISDRRPTTSIDPQYDPEMLKGITLYPYQLEALKVVHPKKNEVGILSLPTGAGKCLGVGTPVIMYDGSIKKVEDILPGDLIMGDDSTSRKVNGVCEGEEPLYLVKQKNGDSYVVNESHILSLMRTPDGKSSSLDHKKFDITVTEYLKSSKTQKHLLKGYKASVSFPKQPLPFDPYLLGLWLGDGISADLQLCLGETDVEIIQYLKEYCNKNGLKVIKYEDPREAADIYVLRLYEGMSRPKNVKPFATNWLKQAFKKLNLFNNKHIPQCFKINNDKSLLLLLAGFIDADGYVDNKDTCTIVHRPMPFIDDIIFIARSLGFRVKKSKCVKSCTTTGYVGNYIRVTISGNINRIPTKLPRRKSISRKSKKNPLVCGITLTPLGVGKYYGFELEGNNKRFLLGDFTVTHNTELMASITKAYNLPTVILADQRIVIEQIKERLELRDVVNSNVGLFYGGSRPNGQTVIVGSIQSLTSPPTTLKRKNYQQWKKRNANSKAFQEIVKQSGLLLVDECVHPSTLIETNRGLIRASEAICCLENNVDLKVRNFGGFDSVIGYKITEKRGAFNVIGENGHSVIVSANHKFAVWHERNLIFKQANELTNNDLLLIASDDKQFNIDESWYLLGLFVGDGHFLNNKQIKFGISKDIDFWSTIGERFVKCFHGSYSNCSNNRKDLVVRIKSSKFIEWIKSLGFKPGRKTGFMKADFDVGGPCEAAGFIKGLLDSEGSIYNNSIKIGMTDYQVIKKIQECLTYLGIYSNVFKTIRDNPKHNDIWTVTVCGQNVLKYLTQIMPDVPSKRSKAFRALELSRKKETIYDGRIYVEFAENDLKLKPKTISKLLGKHELTRIRKGHDKLDYLRIKNFIESLERLSNLKIESYSDAKKYFDIVWKDVSLYLGKSKWYAYKTKPNVQKWYGLIEEKQNKIKEWIKKGDEKKVLPYYRISKFKKIEYVGRNQLIDFVVKKNHVFNAGGFLVHNCDKSIDKRWRNLFMKYYTGRYKYGFSGTPFDKAKPVEALILKEHIGSIIYEIPRKEVEKVGAIIPVHGTMLAIGENGDKGDRTAYDIAQRELVIDNPTYHDKIKQIVDAFPNDRTMILVDTHNVTDLGKALEQKIPGSIFIYGKTTNKKRQEAIKAFQDGNLKCLIGGKILKRGLDIKGGVHNLIICGGGKLWSDFDQKVGRSVRKNDRGYARLFFFLHLNNYYLYRHSKEQLKSMMDMGYNVKVIVNGTTIDGAELIKRRFRLPKKT